MGQRNIFDKFSDCWVKIIGDYFSSSGYSESLRNLIKGFYQNGFPVKADILNYSDRIDLDIGIKNIIDYYNNHHLGNKYVSVLFDTPFFNAKDKNAFYEIGRTFAEMDTIPSYWVNESNNMNEIWLASKHNKETFLRSGVGPEKLFVLPESLDIDYYRKVKTRYKIKTDKRFKFLSVFDFSMRKGWDVLISAFASSFDSSDDVCLVLKTYPLVLSASLSNEKIQQMVREMASSVSNNDPPEIIFIEKLLTLEEMAALYNSCDCFVLPSRGEGWGRPFMEAALLNKPVIATNWGGQLDYLNEETAFLIDYKLENVKPVEIDVYKNTKWANPSAKHLTTILKQVYKNKEIREKKSDKLKKFVEGNYSCKKVAKMAIDRLYDIKESLNNFYVFFPSDTKKEYKNFFKNKKEFVLIDKILKDKLKRNSLIFMHNIIKKEFLELNAHKVLILDKGAEVFISKNNNDGYFDYLYQYVIDDIWANKEVYRELSQKDGLERKLFLLDRQSFDETYSNCKNRIELLMKRPICSNLEKTFKQFNLFPKKIFDTDRTEKQLIYIEFDSFSKYEKELLQYIKNNYYSNDITLIICTSPGKGNQVFDFIESMIRRLRIKNEIILDLLIYDQFMTVSKGAKVISEIDTYINSISMINEYLLACAWRLNKKIIYFNGVGAETKLS